MTNDEPPSPNSEASIKQYVDSWRQVVGFQVSQLRYLFQIQQIYTQRVAAAQNNRVLQGATGESVAASHSEGAKRRLSKDTTKLLTEYYNKTDPKELLSSQNITRLSTTLNVAEAQIVNYLKNKRSRQNSSTKKQIAADPNNVLDSPSQIDEETHRRNEKQVPSVVSRKSSEEMEAEEIQKKIKLLSENDASLGDTDTSLNELLALAKTKKLPSEAKSSILVCLRRRKEQLSVMKSLVEREDGILLLLKQWLQSVSAKESASDITDDDRELVKNILNILEILPITLQSLRSSSIGKIVNKLKSSHLSSEIEKQAKSVVNSWKKLLDSTIVQPEAKKKNVISMKQVSEDFSKKRATAPSLPEDRVGKKIRHSTNQSSSSSTILRTPNSEISTKDVVKQNENRRKKDVVNDKNSTLKANDDLEELAAGKRSINTVHRSQETDVDNRAKKTHKMQFLNPVDPNKSSASMVRASVGTTSLRYDSKPISADDIRKAKQREKLGLPAPSSNKISEEYNKHTSEKTRDDPHPTLTASSSSSITTAPILESTQPPPSTLVSASKTKTKKRVRWAPDDKLVALRTFKKEKRVAASAPSTSSFGELQKGGRKLLREDYDRQYILEQKQKEEEELRKKLLSMSATILWQYIPVVRFEDADGFEIVTALGENSQEVYVQQLRESQNSNVIYWKEESIPESPAEPSEPQAVGDSNQEIFIPVIPYEEALSEGNKSNSTPPILPQAVGVPHTSFTAENNSESLNILASLLQNPSQVQLIANLMAASKQSVLDNPQNNLFHLQQHIPQLSQQTLQQPQQLMHPLQHTPQQPQHQAMAQQIIPQPMSQQPSQLTTHQMPHQHFSQNTQFYTHSGHHSGRYLHSNRGLFRPRGGFRGRWRGT